MQKLWTKNFTIITIGSAISMLGNAVAGFAMGLLVFDNTGSTFLYALFMVCNALPKIALPLFIGPWLDRFSRRKVIYTLDFFSSAFYLLFAAILYMDWFNYGMYLILCTFVGGVDSMYAVAYDSFYPTLITKGNYSRAYSISSLLYPLASTAMVPLAGWCYETIGLIPLFLFNAVTFCIAAIMETRIDAVESHIVQSGETADEQPGIVRVKNKLHFKDYITDLKHGMKYLKHEKGLSTITMYFSLNALTGAAISVLTMPYFKSDPALGISLYTLLVATCTFGRLIGGIVHYRYQPPARVKFTIAIVVYILVSLMDATYLFMPTVIMFVFQFLLGATAVTSFNIRISGTQNYLPDSMRGRFNGIFQMFTMSGTIIGQLIFGAVGEFFPARNIIFMSMISNIVFVFFTMLRNGEAVKEIYNKTV